MIPRDKLPLWAVAEVKPEKPGMVAALFDANHPGVYAAFERIALLAIVEGRTHWSADAIMQTMRHDLKISDGDPHYQINNAHRAYLARRFMAEHPEHRGFFSVRERRGEGEAA
jgi:hypothetical protein